MAVDAVFNHLPGSFRSVDLLSTYIFNVIVYILMISNVFDTDYLKDISVSEMWGNMYLMKELLNFLKFFIEAKSLVLPQVQQLKPPFPGMFYHLVINHTPYTSTGYLHNYLFTTNPFERHLIFQEQVYPHLKVIEKFSQIYQQGFVKTQLTPESLDIILNEKTIHLKNIKTLLKSFSTPEKKMFQLLLSQMKLVENVNLLPEIKQILKETGMI